MYNGLSRYSSEALIGLIPETERVLYLPRTKIVVQAHGIVVVGYKKELVEVGNVRDGGEVIDRMQRGLGGETILRGAR